GCVVQGFGRGRGGRRYDVVDGVADPPRREATRLRLCALCGTGDHHREDGDEDEGLSQGLEDRPSVALTHCNTEADAQTDDDDQCKKRRIRDRLSESAESIIDALSRRIERCELDGDPSQPCGEGEEEV